MIPLAVLIAACLGGTLRIMIWASATNHLPVEIVSALLTYLEGFLILWIMRDEIRDRVRH